MNLTELKYNYDNYLELNYTSKRTIEAYRNCFKKFNMFLILVIFLYICIP